MNKKMTKKTSSILLIVMVLVTILSMLALILARSLIFGINFSLNLSDAIIADEASKAGLEYGLMLNKDDPHFVTTSNGHRINLDANPPIVSTLLPLPTRDPAKRYVDVVINVDGSGRKEIISTGYYSNIFKKHSLVQSE